MADLSIPNSFVADTDATAEDVNENFDAIETAFNDSIASKLADSGTGGQIIVVANTGTPAYVAMSGDATISNAGVVSLAANSVAAAEIAANAVGASEIGSLPAARVYQSAGQTVTGSATAAFDSEHFDTDTIHDNSTNNSRLTCTTAGVYQITADVGAVSSVGVNESFSATIRLNGTTTIAGGSFRPSSAGTGRINISTPYKLAAADYAEVLVSEDVASSLDIRVEFAMTWLGDG